MLKNGKCNKWITIRRYRYAYLWIECGRKYHSLDHIFKIMIAKQFQSSYNEVATNWQQKISEPK